MHNAIFYPTEFAGYVAAIIYWKIGMVRVLFPFNSSSMQSLLLNDENDDQEEE